MSRFQSLDAILAHDKNFREFFSALASGTSNPSATSTDAGSADPTATAPAAGAVSRTTISGDSDTANTDAGPCWTMKSTWNAGNLVNGTDSPQSLTMQNSHTPNVGTTTNWNFHGLKWTIASQGNVVAFAPANSQHLTNNNIDVKALLQAAAAHGLISGNEYSMVSRSANETTRSHRAPSSARW